MSFSIKCEPLWPPDSQYFWVTANRCRPIADHFCYRIRKKTLVGEVLNNKEQCEQTANHCESIKKVIRNFLVLTEKLRIKYMIKL